MIVLVTGGSGSGKSEYAENLAVQLAEVIGAARRFYVATMDVSDSESRERVARHRSMRAGKGFITVEQRTNLGELVERMKGKGEGSSEKKNIFLLEDLTNLFANEIYLPEGKMKEYAADQKFGMQQMIIKPCLELGELGSLIIVTNEIFSDGMEYAEETERFIRMMGTLNRILAMQADGVAEVVCGIPVWQKGRKPC